MSDLRRVTGRFRPAVALTEDPAEGGERFAELGASRTAVGPTAAPDSEKERTSSGPPSHRVFTNPPLIGVDQIAGGNGDEPVHIALVIFGAQMDGRMPLCLLRRNRRGQAFR